MKKILLTGLVAAALTAAPAAVAGQRLGSLFINEVMTANESNYVDDFGERSAWIELFNAQFAPLQISSIYITTDSTNTTMYPVPIGDVNTVIPKRQHVLFWADGRDTRGTFHARVTLDPTTSNWIGIYDADKITLLDSVTVPVLAPNTSYARIIDGINVIDPATGRVITEKTWEVRDDADGKPITPSSNNVIKDHNDKIETFHDQDENGFALTIMAMAIVFSALLLLCLCFLLISKIGGSISRSNKMKAQGLNIADVPRSERPDHDTGEEIAAIAMALRDHLDAHDTESTRLTINKVKRAYSPWSSKIYNMRHMPGQN